MHGETVKFNTYSFETITVKYTIRYCAAVIFSAAVCI